MKRLSVYLPLAILLVASGCGDSPTAATRVLTVRIEHGTDAVEEEAVRVGETLALLARVLDENGVAVVTEPVEWSSTDPAKATVSGGGLVTGQGLGHALVIASAGSARDTVRVNVVEPPAGPVRCGPTDGAIALAVGAVHLTNAYDAVTLCVAGGAGSEYALVPFYASDVPSAALGLDFTAEGIAAVAGPPTPSRMPERVRPAGPAADADFHLRLHERTRRAFPSPLPLPAAAPALRLAAIPAVGDELRINADALSTDPCVEPDVWRTGRVAAVTRHAVVLADVENPANGFTGADYAELGHIFDELIHPVVTTNFGEPSDIDGNGRAVIFFTRAVNELTGAGSNTYVGGFFYNRDLYRRTGQNACAGSNEAEVFYMMVPDPTGEVNRNIRTREFVRRKTVAVLAHEFQHLVNDSRRLFVNRTRSWEEKWLSEGLSHVAEELVFYEASGLRPRTNLGPGALVATGAVKELGTYQLDNLERFASYLLAAPTTPLTGTSDDLATRGAAWSFLRYAADRRGGSEQALWLALVRDTRESGMANLRAALGSGVEPLEWARDWSVATYADDAVDGVEARYTQPSWDFRALLPALSGLVDGRRFTTYPLHVIHLRGGVERSLLLRGGGAAHLRFGVPAGDTAAIRTLSSSGLPGPTRVQLALVRTR